jgi:hypothetical protein
MPALAHRIRRNVTRQCHSGVRAGPTVANQAQTKGGLRSWAERNQFPRQDQRIRRNLAGSKWLGVRDDFRNWLVTAA